MTSHAIALLRRPWSTFTLSPRPAPAEHNQLQDDVWRAIAFAVDRAAADILPLSANGGRDIVAGHRALATLVGGQFLLSRVQDRNARYIGQAGTCRERYRRRREVASLRPYVRAFRKAIGCARAVAEGHPAPGKPPALLQSGAGLPLIQRFRQDRHVLPDVH